MMTFKVSATAYRAMEARVSRTGKPSDRIALLAMRRLVALVDRYGPKGVTLLLSHEVRDLTVWARLPEGAAGRCRSLGIEIGDMLEYAFSATSRGTA